MAMITILDLEKIVSINLEKYINIELLIDDKVKIGWFQVITSMVDEDEITSWLAENVTHQYVGYCTIWAFEDQNESVEFLLRFGKA